MLWFVFALLSAFFVATEAVLTKVLLRRNDAWTTGWIICTLSVPFLAPLMLGQGPIRFSGEFFLLCSILLPVESLAYWLYLTALQTSPVSLTVPFMAFTPVFTILTGWLFLGETLPRGGIAGILFISAGAYLLQANLVRHSIFAPIKAVFTHRGSRAMLLVSFLYSITSTLGKKAVLLVGARPFAVIYMAFFSVVLTVFLLRNRSIGRGTLHLRNRYWVWALLGGLAMALETAFHFLAIERVAVAYMISVKRTSIVFSVLYGWLIFREEFILYRFGGATVMVIGVVFIYLS